MILKMAPVGKGHSLSKVCWRVTSQINDSIMHAGAHFQTAVQRGRSEGVAWRYGGGVRGWATSRTSPVPALFIASVCVYRRARDLHPYARGAGAAELCTRGADAEKQGRIIAFGHQAARACTGDASTCACPCMSACGWLKWNGNPTSTHSPILAKNLAENAVSHPDIFNTQKKNSGHLHKCNRSATNQNQRNGLIRNVAKLFNPFLLSQLISINLVSKLKSFDCPLDQIFLK